MLVVASQCFCPTDQGSPPLGYAAVSQLQLGQKAPCFEGAR
jgi:hypothetical protein